MREIHVRLKRNGAYWKAAWIDSAGDTREKSLGPRAKISNRQARILCQRLASEMRLNPSRRDAGKAPRLREYLDRYLEHRTDLRPRVWKMHHKTAEYLAGRIGEDGQAIAGFFDPALRIDRITRADAADWRAWIAAKELTEATICNHVRTVKVMFKRAVNEDLIPFNPFDRLKGTAPAPDKDWRYVTRDELQKMLAAAPDRHWRIFLSLQRLAGLRRGEALALQWPHVDWQARRLTVFAEKTGMKRLVPIEPELYRQLLEAFEAAEPGVEPVAPVSENNLHRRMVALIKRAGLAPWPDPFQVLRRNCETDWAQLYPQYAVSTWIGHDIAVSAKHYLQVPEELFDKLAGIKEPEPQQQPDQQGQEKSR